MFLKEYHIPVFGKKLATFIGLLPKKVHEEIHNRIFFWKNPARQPDPKPDPKPEPEPNRISGRIADPAVH